MSLMLDVSSQNILDSSKELAASETPETGMGTLVPSEILLDHLSTLLRNGDASEPAEFLVSCGAPGWPNNIFGLDESWQLSAYC